MEHYGPYLTDQIYGENASVTQPTDGQVSRGTRIDQLFVYVLEISWWRLERVLGLQSLWWGVDEQVFYPS